MLLFNTFTAYKILKVRLSLGYNCHFCTKLNYMVSTEIISGMLAPGIMISACGLLLLGMNNKYSLVVSRIRMLNQEYRGLKKVEEDRKENIELQIPMLSRRIRLIKNTVWFYTSGVALFIMSILSIGLGYIADMPTVTSTITLILFIGGIISILIGVLHAANEVRLGYRIVQIETEYTLNSEGKHD